VRSSSRFGPTSRAKGITLAAAAVQAGDKSEPDRVGRGSENDGYCAGLAQHAGPVVTKDELMKAVWRDVIVTDESLPVCISEVRRALGDKHQHGRRADGRVAR
jgi:hypothetical protein